MAASLLSWLLSAVLLGTATALPAETPSIQQMTLGHDGTLPANGPQYLPLPSQDPFYTPPSNWTAAKPGDVLRVRPHAYPTINIRNCKDTFQLLYRTTDSNNNATWAAATVFIPQSIPADCLDRRDNGTFCPRALVSYQVPSDSADPNAAPSYLLQSREPYGEMRDMLKRGWFVLVPDYEGPQASFCAGVQAGHATLDAARAVRHVARQIGLEDAAADTNTERFRFALWGYSGGAFATQFAAELAAAYAPELPMDAVVVGGSSPNMTTVDERMNRRDTAGLVVTSILGITAQQPAARRFVESRLRQTGPRNATIFMSALAMTGADALEAFSGQDVLDYFERGRDDLWGHPLMQALVDRDAVMGLHGVPRMPSFYYKAMADEMSPVAETDDLVAAQCRQGANILYHRNQLGGHNDELWSGRPRALEYLAAKLEGRGNMTMNMTIPETGCSTVEVSVPLEPLYLLPDWWWTEGPGAGLGYQPGKS